MPRGRAASNLAMGIGSLKSGISNRSVPTPMGLLGRLLHTPSAPPMNIPSAPLINVGANVNRAPAFPSTPNTIAPPIIGGPPMTFPTDGVAPVNMPNMPVNNMPMKRRY
jgi:hypothetical protein